ncbi:MAG: DUF2294 family protein [Clostridiales bacterium]|nr:DUF2294 family protein [Clostridiales bacterium]
MSGGSRNTLRVISLHTDISTKTGEQIFIFVLEREL